MVERAEKTIAVWSRMLTLWALNSLEDRGSIVKKGMKSKLTPYFSVIAEYGEAAYGGCWEIRMFLTVMYSHSFYKTIAVATRIPVGKISRAQRYKIAENTERVFLKICASLTMQMKYSRAAS